MRKTLVALFALTGVASGATLSTNIDTLWTMNFGSGYTNGYQITEDSGSYSPSVWDVNGYTTEDGVNTSGSKRPHLQGDTGVTWGDSFQFTVTFTLAEDSSTWTASNNWPVIATLTDGSDNVRFGPYVGNSNYANLDGNSGTVFQKEQENLVQLTAGTHTAIMQFIDNEVSLWIDGTLACVADMDTTTYGADEVINNIALGGDTGGAYRINSNIQSISMGLINNVPEPATASLSLLGLAALMIRRRRA